MQNRIFFIPRAAIKDTLTRRVAMWGLLLAFASISIPRLSAAPAINYAAVERAIAEHRFVWAQQEAEKILNLNPHDFRAHMLLGIILDELGQPDEALLHLKTAVELGPRSPEAHTNLGEHYMQRANIAEAIDEFESALRLDDVNPVAHRNLGAALMAQGKGVEGVAELSKAVHLAPRDLPMRLDLFKAELSLRLFPEARSTAKQIVAHSPATADVYGKIGAMQAQAGDLAGAIENLKKARGLEPPSPEIVYNLGLAYYRLGDLDHALATLETLRHEKESAEVENLLGEVNEARKDYLDAVRAYQKAAEMAPRSEDYRLDFILELLAHRSFDAAVADAERAVQQFDNSLKLRMALGIAYFGYGDSAKSIQSFVEGAKRYPDAELPLYFLAIASDTTGRDMDQTEEMLLAYVKRHPEPYWLYYYLGKMAYGVGQKTGHPDDFLHAEELLKESLRRKKDHPESHYALGNVYFNLRRWQETIDEYRNAIQLKPDLAEAHYRLSQAYRRVGKTSDADAEIAIHRKLRAEEAQKNTRDQEVSVFLYQLRQ
jgi:tetratricopeptide (TPR) repeat protein